MTSTEANDGDDSVPEQSSKYGCWPGCRALVHRAADTVSVLLGVGDGSFADSAEHPAGREPSSVAVGDLNGDGEPDLAVADYGLDAVSVLLASGAGNFPANLSDSGGDPDSIALDDLNGDCR